KMAAWKVIPAAAKNIQFKRDSNLFRMARYISWNYFWSGRKYGLLFHDQFFEPAPEVQEALRRLNLKEPWKFDERKVRLTRAHVLAMHGEKLPKDKWTKWEDETWYLKPYLDEVEAEKEERLNSSGIVPDYQMPSSKGH
uniref:Cytochrome b-c1 complex subunit 7 n=2 Tax=Strongyloides stercoralis TaxID=6248 RepID=A0AAF5HY99_STRER